MRPKNNRKPLRDEAPKVRRAPGSPTKSQLRAHADAIEQARFAKWKTVLGIAGTTWSKVHATELSRSNGDINVLAGLVQLRHALSRQEADSQVKAFYDQHMQIAPITLSSFMPAVSARPAAEPVVAPVASSAESA
ncbi:MULTISPECIES: hypothetical protein [Hydrocarboniphaga]|jgi:hypothetical protein|uniref:Uncharacterized protein n=2 Tax=Hydrocarboniphaga effusa TaxID=243629 RepID=I7ZJ57_9GAMM|nr:MULTISPECIES: hypothetical protein [Hydrocarboniphaga]EIT71807.1 hypothetical protein WQQ_19440 [Hydrocarboniphaga effusa AP103]MDZ4080428.1 hypothetical protein [Hydrocarboniphaga sp.]